MVMILIHEIRELRARGSETNIPHCEFAKDSLIYVA